MNLQSIEDKYLRNCGHQNWSVVPLPAVRAYWNWTKLLTSKLETTDLFGHNCARKVCTTANEIMDAWISTRNVYLYMNVKLYLFLMPTGTAEIERA